jgi:hypothetical protein
MLLYYHFFSCRYSFWFCFVLFYFVMFSFYFLLFNSSSVMFTFLNLLTFFSSLLSLHSSIPHDALMYHLTLLFPFPFPFFLPSFSVLQPLENEHVRDVLTLFRIHDNCFRGHFPHHRYARTHTLSHIHSLSL